MAAAALVALADRDHRLSELVTRDRVLSRLGELKPVSVRDAVETCRAQGLDAADIGRLPDPNLTQPAAFIGGELDPVRNFAPGIDMYEFAAMACDDFRGTTIVDGAGHWVQQEAPAATNAALDDFVTGL